MIVATALALAGCTRKDETAPVVKPNVKVAPSAPQAPPAPTVAELFPLSKGNSWTYDVEVGGKSEPEMIWTVVKSEKVEDGVRATIELDSGNSIEQQTWLQTDKGLYQVSGADRMQNEPPQPMFQTPLTAGSRFTYSGKAHSMNGETGTINAQGVVLGMQEVDTGVGKLKAMAVETNSSYRETGDTTEAVITTWYAPKVGMVRFRMEVKGAPTSLLTLRKTNIK
jgi:hypothetical protein